MNKEPGKLIITNNEGKQLECDVLFTFDSDETGKSYIAYTDNTKDENGNIRVYASIYDPMPISSNSLIMKSSVIPAK